MSLGALPDYPWDSMVQFRQRAEAHPGGMVDLSIGSPVDPTPELIRSALAEASDSHGYPVTVGTGQLQQAILKWLQRRRGVVGLGREHVLPTIGSKELVAWLPFMLGLGAGDVVVHPRAAYPTYEMGAVYAGATAFASDDPADWPEATKLVWLNSPGNPDGRVLDVGQLRAALARARELGAVIVNDECYAELPWTVDEVPSILDPRVTDGVIDDVLMIYSLSKQSSMAGYRAAFVAGDAQRIARLTVVRKHAGMIVPGPLQHAMTVALGDDAHVAEQRERYRRRRDTLKPALEAAGFGIDLSDAGLYLWASEGRDAWDSIGRLADLGILAGPGHFYGVHFPNHVRLSLTASDASIAQAAERLRG